MHTEHFWMQLPRSMKDKIHLAGFNALLSGDSSRVDLLPGLTMPCGRSGLPSRHQPFHAGRFIRRTLFLWSCSLLGVTGYIAPLLIPWAIYSDTHSMTLLHKAAVHIEIKCHSSKVGHAIPLAINELNG